MYTVYVIENQAGKHYIGQTNNLPRRLETHNLEKFDGYTARIGGPWRIVYSEVLPTRADALRQEHYLKQGAGARWLKDKLNNRRGVA